MGASTLESGYRVELLLEAVDNYSACYALNLERADGTSLSLKLQSDVPAPLADTSEAAYVDSLLRLLVKGHAADGRWPRKLRRWRAER